jgi:DNA-binding response OmpR family regulator
MGLVKHIDDPGIRKQRLVVIDDEPGTVDLLKMYFEMFNFDVATALTGTGGLKAIMETAPTAVILDLMLPDMDGLEVCRQVRSMQATALLPVIMLSARTSRDDVQEGYDAGATAYFKKPVDLNKLLSETRRILAAGGHTAPLRPQQDFDANAPATGVAHKNGHTPADPTAVHPAAVISPAAQPQPATHAKE